MKRYKQLEGFYGMLGRRFTALRGSAKAMAGGGFYLWDWKHGVLDSLCGILFLYMHARYSS